jgi:hypothetical protein
VYWPDCNKWGDLVSVYKSAKACLTLAALVAGYNWIAPAYADEHRLKAYYCMYEEQQCTDKFEIEAKHIAHLARVVLSDTEGNFLGFVDADGTALQFIVIAKDRVGIDLPVPAAEASYQREVDVEGALKIIDTLTAPLLAYKSKLDLELREWRPGDPGVRR